MQVSKWLAGLALCVTGAVSWADTVALPTNVYSIEYDADYPSCCGVIQGRFANIDYGAYDFSLGFAEFDLGGLAEVSGPGPHDSIDSASLSFTLSSIGPNAYGPTNNVSAFWGRNSPAVTDIYGTVSRGSFLSLNIASFQAGSRFVVDATNLLNAALRNDARTLGMRVSGFVYTDRSNAFVLSDISLSVTDANLVAAVPEPSEYALLSVGFPLLALAMRRSRKQAAAVIG
jgi:hypothetical protein